MVAHCSLHGENKCKLTRSCDESARTGRQGQGRPLGLMLAWLSQADRHGSAQEHVHTEDMPSLEERLMHRESNQDAPGIQWLQDNAERPPRAGEGLEPEVAP